MDRQAVKERFGIIGSSPAINRVLDQVRQVAASDITVLIQGESGVGKELFAQAIHGLSSRRHKPWVVVNCGAIPEGLIESELFGHEKGSYTGATDRRAGHFEEADQGTIFLDEIGEMPAAAQVRLLRVLESGQFSRVGSSKLQQVDVRVVAATNKDLGREVRAGRFREDLYYRLSTVLLKIPPLRDRKEDIREIFELLLFRFAQDYNAPMKHVTQDARHLMEQYSWPGNVRELRNVAEQSVVLVRDEHITGRHLQSFLRGVSAGEVAETHLVPSGPPPPGGERELLYRALFEMRMEIRELREAVRALVSTRSGNSGEESASYAHERPYTVYADGSVVPPGYPTSNLLPVPQSYMPPSHSERTIDEIVDFHEDTEESESDELPPFSGKDELPTMQEMELALIQEGLRRFDGNRRQTAKVLGISERTLYRKIKELEAYESLQDD